MTISLALLVASLVKAAVDERSAGAAAERAARLEPVP
jgi:hypothetical protein